MHIQGRTDCLHVDVSNRHDQLDRQMEIRTNGRENREVQRRRHLLIPIREIVCNLTKSSCQEARSTLPQSGADLSVTSQVAPGKKWSPITSTPSSAKASDEACSPSTMSPVKIENIASFPISFIASIKLCANIPGLSQWEFPNGCAGSVTRPVSSVKFLQQICFVQFASAPTV